MQQTSQAAVCCAAQVTALVWVEVLVQLQSCLRFTLQFSSVLILSAGSSEDRGRLAFSAAVCPEFLHQLTICTPRCPQQASAAVSSHQVATHMKMRLLSTSLEKLGAMHESTIPPAGHKHEECYLPAYISHLLCKVNSHPSSMWCASPGLPARYSNSPPPIQKVKRHLPKGLRR